MLHLLDEGTPDAIATDGLDPVVAAEIDHLAGRHDRWVLPTPNLHVAFVARAQVAAGRAEEAMGTLAGARPRPTWPMHALAAWAWATSRIGIADQVTHADRILAAAGATGDSFLVSGDMPVGPGAMYRGVLAAALGDLDRAADLLRVAVQVGDARSSVWGARARLELTRVLLDQGADRETAQTEECRAMSATARLFFEASGYEHQLGLLERLTGDGDTVDGLAAPALGRLRSGDPWRVGFGVQPSVATQPYKGLAAIRYLVDHRGRRVPAVELDAALSPDGAERLADIRRAIDEGADPGTQADLRAVFFDDRVHDRVSKLLRRTIVRLDSVHPRLSRHLQSTIETGVSCAYVGGDHVRWSIA